MQAVLAIVWMGICMISILSYFVIFIITAALFFGISFLIEKSLSYNGNRYLHYRLVIISFVYSFIVSNPLVGPSVLNIAGSIINNQSVVSFFRKYMIDRGLELNFLFLYIAVLNIAFAVSYLIILGIFRLIIFRKKERFVDFDSLVGMERIRYAPWFVVNKFYEEENGIVKLKPFCHSLGLFIKGMKFGTVIFCVIENLVIIFSVLFGSNSWNTQLTNAVMQFYLMPMAAYFVFHQMQLFLETPGDSRLGLISTMNIPEELNGQVEALIPCYQEVFGKALLCSEFGAEKTEDEIGLVSNDAGNDLSEKCEERGVFNIIINQLKQADVELNSSFEDAVVHLLNGYSVLVKDNIEGEFTPYYANYINYYISKGQNALVVCSDKEMVIKLQNELATTVKRANGGNMLWVIATADDLGTRDDINVIICTYQELTNINTQMRYGNIFRDVFVAVFPDVVGLVSQNNIFLELLLSKLRSLSNLKQYVFISKVDTSFIKDRIQFLFYSENLKLEAFNHDIRPAHTGVMVWKGESFYRFQNALNIGGAQSPYLGSALPIAFLAVKKDFPRVHLINGQCVGDNTFLFGAMPSHKAGIKVYFGGDVDVANKISVRDSEAIKPEDMKIICVYDDDYNFFNAIWKWIKYAGRKGTIIHVISPFYMLREYFADNYRNIINNHNEYRALYNSGSVLDYSRKAMLLAMFADCDIEEDDLLNYAKHYGLNCNDITVLLLDCMKTARPQRDPGSFFDYFKYNDKSWFDSENDIIEKYQTIKLSDANIISELRDKVACAYYVIGQRKKQFVNVLSGNIFNYFLEDQIIPVSGEYYKVNQVNDGIVYLLPSTPSELYDYFPISDFSIEPTSDKNTCTDDYFFDFNILEAKASRRIYGYISSINGNDFSDQSHHIKVNSFEEPVVVKMSKVPVLEINIRKEHVNNDIRTIVLLSNLLNGLFKTIFPNSYQNIFAIADQPFDIELCDKVLEGKHNYTTEELVKITQPGLSETTNYPLDNDYFRISIVEFSCIEYGMVSVLYENRMAIMYILFRYLNWYLASGNGRYIHYGMQDIPSIFSPNGLLAFLKNALNTDEAPIVGNNDNIVKDSTKRFETETCTFCGNTTSFWWKFGDGRVMCGHCHDHMKTQEDEIIYILDSTRDRLFDIYHIEETYKKSVKSINVRFQSKDAIERVAGRMTNGRTLGFYRHSDRELWIERKGPAVTMQSTMAHELTHAWQFFMLDETDDDNKVKMKRFEKALGKHYQQKKKVLLEGHAVYIEIDIMKRLGEKRFAEMLENEYSERDDAYGVGYHLFKEYIDNLDDGREIKNPFAIMIRLVDEIIKGEEPIKWPENIGKL